MIYLGRKHLQYRAFSTKQDEKEAPEAETQEKETVSEKEEAEIERFREKNNKYNRRFNKLLSREVVPLVVAAISIIGVYQFRT